MKNLLFIIISFAFIGCDDSPKTMVIDKLASDQINSSEYYFFKGGTKLRKAEWMNTPTVVYMLESVNDTEFVFRLADCFMTEVSNDFFYREIDKLMGDASSIDLNELLESNQLFYDLGLDSYIQNCARKMGGKVDSSTFFNVQSLRQQKLLAEQLRLEFFKNEEFKIFAEAMNTGIFFECLAENIVETFPVSELVSGEAYQSKKYEEITTKCMKSAIDANPEFEEYSDWQNFTDKKLGFSIAYPELYKQIPSLVYKVPFKVGDEISNVVLVVNDQTKYQSAEQINVSDYLKRISTELPNAEVLKKSIVHINGEKALNLELHVIANTGQSFNQRQFIVIKEGKEILLTFTVPTKSLKDYEKINEKMAKTLVIL